MAGRERGEGNSGRTGRRFRSEILVALTWVAVLVLLLVMMMLHNRVQAEPLAPRFTASPASPATAPADRGELQVTGRLLLAPCQLSPQVMLTPEGHSRRVMLLLEGCGNGQEADSRPALAAVSRWTGQEVYQPLTLRHGLNRLSVPSALTQASRLEIRYE